METLILTPDICHTMWHLHDAKMNSLGWFKSVQEAQTWCKENGYRLRVER